MTGRATNAVAPVAAEGRERVAERTMPVEAEAEESDGAAASRADEDGGGRRRKDDAD